MVYIYQGDNSRPLAISGRQTMVQLFYITLISVDLAQYEIVRAQKEITSQTD